MPDYYYDEDYCEVCMEEVFEQGKQAFNERYPGLYRGGWMFAGLTPKQEREWNEQQKSDFSELVLVPMDNVKEVRCIVFDTGEGRTTLCKRHLDMARVEFPGD